MNIGNFGLDFCSTCQHRFDCQLTPSHTSMWAIDNWVKILVLKVRHDINKFRRGSYLASLKCVFDIKESIDEANHETVILDGEFFNELLLYARINYPNFERRE